MKAWTAIVAPILLLVSAAAVSGQVQSLQALQAAARQAVLDAAPQDARVVAVADELDPRLRLPACPTTLEAEAPDLHRGAARISVAVSCTAGAAWKIRVPVRVRMFLKVLVSSHGLARGDVVGRTDVHVEERDVARLAYGYLLDADRLLGRKLRRAVAGDTVLTPAMLAPRELVRRGEQVSLVANAGRISVRATGIALQAGDRGDPVRVRSLSCDCVVQGTVSKPGVVETVP